MAISFACDCGKLLRAGDELAGKKTRCPDCAAILRIPGPTAAPTPGPAPTRWSAGSGSDPEGDPYELADPVPAPRPRPGPAPTAPERPRPMTWGATSTPPPAAPILPSTFRPTRGHEASSVAAAPAKKGRAGAGGRGGDSTIREYAHLLLAFALIPLVVSLLGRGGPSDLLERFNRSVEQATPDAQARIRAAMEGNDLSVDQAIALLPQGRIDGAHLARDSQGHWAWAAVAGAGFLLLLMLMFSVERAVPWHLAGIGAFTGTVGILFLLAVQFCSHLRFGFRGFRGGGVWIVVVLILMFIGWSYGSALDPGSNFLLSALGFTFGVGLCEEFTKAIPILFSLRRHSEMGWRTACLWGLASGIGFGVSEGVLYAARDYNGVSGVDIYLVRFVSCVALHAMWSASVGIAVARNVDDYQRADDAPAVGLFMLRMMAVPMTLHGFYDTFLKKDMNLAALGVAALSFGWFAWHVELARKARPGAGRPKAKQLDSYSRYAPMTPVG